MSLKFSFIFVELYCLFVITKCVEISPFDISDVISEPNSYFYTTRDLEEVPIESLDEIPIEPVPVKPVYVLAKEFVADFEILLHKITQTFVAIGQKKEGQKTLLHIYDEMFTVASHEISVGTLKYLMQQSLRVMQHPNASKIVVEFFETIQDVLKYDLADWHFVVPFFYDIMRHPVPEQILTKFGAEVEYILLSEDRKKSFAAGFRLLEDAFNGSATETSIKAIPIEIGEPAPSAERVTQIPVKQVTQVPVKQVEQVTQIPVKQIKSNQVSVEQVTQVPLKQVTTVPVKQVTQVPVRQVEQVTQIPVKQIKSNQVAEEEVSPVQVETAVTSPMAPESTASKVLRRVKSLPSYFKQSTPAEQVKIEQVQN